MTTPDTRQLEKTDHRLGMRARVLLAAAAASLAVAATNETAYAVCQPDEPPAAGGVGSSVLCEQYAAVREYVQGFVDSATTPDFGPDGPMIGPTGPAYDVEGSNQHG